MFVFRPQKRLSVAREYFREHLSVGDGKLAVVPGQWIGRGAARLGLGGPVEAEAFDRLCQNRHPHSGAPLTVRQMTDNRRVYFDFVVAPPKSVSILAFLGRDSRVAEAEAQALQTALTELERFAATRVRSGGRDEDRRTREIVGVTFRHEWSRALDPQIHTHVVVMNATWDATERRWKALQPMAITERLPFLTEVYRSELAANLTDLGYRLVPGYKGSFEVAGVEPLIRRFSKRSEEIEHVAQTLTEKFGREVSPEGRAVIAQTTRDWKFPGTAANAVWSHVRSQVTDAEMDELRQVIAQAIGHRPEAASISPAAAVDHARDHLFERRSTVDETDLFREALRFGRRDIRLDEVRRELNSRPEFVRVGERLTTHVALRLEQEVIQHVNEQMDRHPPFVRQPTVVVGLSEEQQAAVDHLLTSRHGVARLAGGAGTGKTRVLVPMVKQLQAAGHRVQVCAPTTEAVEVLRKDGFGEAITLQRLLLEKPTEPNVLLVDEANLMSLAQMRELLHLPGRKILSGDNRQHHSVEAGDALRIIETRTRLPKADLTEIRRQKSEPYRRAVGDIARGNIGLGYAMLNGLGAIEEVTDHAPIAKAYVEAVKAKRDVLVVAPTWKEIGAVTKTIRAELQSDGALSKAETKVDTHSSLDWTEAQRRDLRNYRPGLVLRFQKSTENFRSGEWARVKEVLVDRLIVQRANGTEVRITKKQAGCFDVAERIELAVATGDRLLIQANHRAAGLYNGQLVRVKSVGEHIRLTDGRKIPKGFRSFTHGYCVTSMASEGKTVDVVLMSVSNAALVGANQRQFYVSVSRGRYRVKVFTEDRAALLEAVKAPGIRQSALELVETVKPEVAPKLAPCLAVGHRR